MLMGGESCYLALCKSKTGSDSSVTSNATISTTIVINTVIHAHHSVFTKLKDRTFQLKQISAGVCGNLRTERKCGKRSHFQKF